MKGEFAADATHLSFSPLGADVRQTLRLRLERPKRRCVLAGDDHSCALREWFSPYVSGFLKSCSISGTSLVEFVGIKVDIEYDAKANSLCLPSVQGNGLF